jgi:hypothetical protein
MVEVRIVGEMKERECVLEDGRGRMENWDEEWICFRGWDMGM